jgi:hypothetical protein
MGWIAVLTAAIILIPIPIWNAQFKDIDGYYELFHCPCGHYTFLELHEGKVFYTSAGHKDRTQKGTLLSTSDQWEIVVNSSTTTVFKADSNGYIKVKPASNTHESTLQRVRNPWRIWLPWILPE